MGGDLLDGGIRDCPPSRDIFWQVVARAGKKKNRKLEERKMKEIKKRAGLGKLLMEWDGDEQDNEFAWKDFCEDLTFVLQERNPSGKWNAEVENFGWDKRSGRKSFEAKTGSDFLRELLPNCDCRFKIFAMGLKSKGIAVQNFHHDSPMGAEWYCVLPQKG